MKALATRAPALAAILALAAMLGGCIVSDQLTTITIHPDGSAEFIKVLLNVHSSETGAKADEELQRYAAEFNAGKDPDLVRIADAGGRVLESRWIRSDPPCAAMIVAKLPSAAVLEKAFSFNESNGESVATARFTRDGARRKFSLLMALPRDQVESLAPEKSVQELRANQANGLSEMRFVVAGGKISSVRGFTVARDKQSALLEPKAILEMLRTQRPVEVFIEWEVE
jgi:hypothetical protein